MNWQQVAANLQVELGNQLVTAFGEIAVLKAQVKELEDQLAAQEGDTQDATDLS